MKSSFGWRREERSYQRKGEREEVEEEDTLEDDELRTTLKEWTRTPDNPESLLYWTQTIPILESHKCHREPTHAQMYPERE